MSPTADQRWIGARVKRWCALYTRGLPPEVAESRQEELAADLLDQIEWSTDRGMSHEATDRALTWRAVRGAPSDLAWRRAQLRDANALEFANRRFGGWLLAGSSSLGLLLIGVASIAISRDRLGFAHGDPLLMPTVVAELVVTCGLILLTRKRTRALGALWLAAGGPAVAVVGLNLLAERTTLLLYVTETSGTWRVGQIVVAACIGLLFLAAAAWWAPSRVNGPDR